MFIGVSVTRTAREGLGTTIMMCHKQLQEQKTLLQTDSEGKRERGMGEGEKKRGREEGEG